MSNSEKNKKNPPKKSSPPSKGRKPVGRSGPKDRTTDFFIGSRDILAGPEIASPHEAVRQTSSGKKESASRRKSERTAPEVMSETIPSPAQPSRKGRKASPAKPAKGKAAEPTAKSAKAPAEPAPRAPKHNRKGASGKTVKAEDSIVRPAASSEAAPPMPKGGLYAGLKAMPDAKLRVIPLGGLNEVGKNMTVVEYGDDIIIIDCGIGFPDEDEMPGIDLVIPDVTYLENNRQRIRGMVLTHGHEDHIGAIPYILQKLDVPIYGTRLTLGILENKLREHTLPWKAQLRCVKAGDTLPLGASFSVEFIHVNHSIADACALAIRTPLGLIVHTGDFKLDLTPIEGEMMDITRMGELGREGVLLMM